MVLALQGRESKTDTDRSIFYSTKTRSQNDSILTASLDKANKNVVKRELTGNMLKPKRTEDAGKSDLQSSSRFEPLDLDLYMEFGFLKFKIEA